MTKSKATEEELWANLVARERKFFAARMALVKARTALLTSDANVIGIVRRALHVVADRGTALRLLFYLEERDRREVFPDLIQVASVGHADIQLVREVILTIDHQWLLEHISAEIERVLTASATSEEYGRFAELLEMINSPYLVTLVESAAASDNIEIREIAEEYRSRL